jgi:hypothetical protein
MFYDQVKNREKLLKFLDISELLTLKQIREIYHRNEESKYL